MKFLLTRADLDQRHDQIVRLLSPVVSEAGRGEFTVEDLIGRAHDGLVYIGISDEPELCGAFEFKHYPQSMAVNIIALGGSGFNEVAVDWITKFTWWAQVSGASTIEASCSRAMARILKRIGFSNEYEVVRLKI